MQKPKAQMQPRAVGQWTTGLWDCFSDLGNCFTTLFCPCVTFGQVAHIVHLGKASVFAEGRNYALLSCCCCCYSCFARSKLRYMYNLPPSYCGDCLVHTCCEPCALCQEYRELQNRGFNMAIGWDLNMTQVGITIDPPIGQMMNAMETINNIQDEPEYDNQDDTHDQ
nr:PREDICTED: protein PLANT CADMIUM RESISTANCE 2-like [Daucus carota subsp. sativus]